MNVNSDFSQRVLLHSPQLAWLESPMAGVQRRMLDRIGAEVARATSIVRYQPGSHFSPHVHGGGEEFLVLEGVFQDEHGDFPAGTYIRNPPESRHSPGSAPGCVIFVKLWQFDLSDRTPVCTHIDKIGALRDPTRADVLVSPLYQDPQERVRVETWCPGATVTVDATGGAELLVLQGSCWQASDELLTHSWLRMPHGSTLHCKAGPRGTRVWIKSGHLQQVQSPAVS